MTVGIAVATTVASIAERNIASKIATTVRGLLECRGVLPVAMINLWLLPVWGA